LSVPQYEGYLAEKAAADLPQGVTMELIALVSITTCLPSGERIVK
jgi:hypothetical protein